MNIETAQGYLDAYVEELDRIWEGTTGSFSAKCETGEPYVELGHWEGMTTWHKERGSFTTNYIIPEACVRSYTCTAEDALRLAYLALEWYMPFDSSPKRKLWWRKRPRLVFHMLGYRVQMRLVLADVRN